MHSGIKSCKTGSTSNERGVNTRETVCGPLHGIRKHPGQEGRRSRRTWYVPADQEHTPSTFGGTNCRIPGRENKPPSVASPSAIWSRHNLAARLASILGVNNHLWVISKEFVVPTQVTTALKENKPDDQRQR